MSRDSKQVQPNQTGSGLTRALAEYANRLLLGTGLEAGEALGIARGDLDAPAHLRSLQTALRAGWHAEDPTS
jgi:hypothetical protein